MDKNTQQQASWEYFDGTWHVGVDGERENYEMFGYPTRDLYTAPPGPCYVLMALPSFDDVIAVQRREVMANPSDAYMVGLYNGMIMMDANYKNSTDFEYLTVQKQPQAVNHQLLARWLAFGKAMQKAGSELPRHLIADTEAAIAAAEAAQKPENNK